VTKRGYYSLFATVFDHCLLKCELNDEIFASIIPDLVATNIQDERVDQSLLNLNFKLLWQNREA
jgi:hypothetical protein